MKKALIVSFCLLFALSSLVMARPVAKNNAQKSIQVYNNLTDRPLDGLFSSAQADTYVLAEYTFDVSGQCNAEGWTSVDLTAQIGTLFHVDTFHPVSGAQSMWCGHRASTSAPWCGYAFLPGYGNSWNQYFETTGSGIAVSGDATFVFSAFYDSEPGYDYTYVDYADTSGGWANLYTLTGAGTLLTATSVIPAGAIPSSTLDIRFHFQSDGAWSDEDGLWDTQGAVIVDDISVSDISGVVNTEDFESEAVGATATNDGVWAAYPGSGFGDFAGLFPGVSVLQQDVCTQDLTCLWGFFNHNNPSWVYDCDANAGSHPEQKVVPYHNNAGQYINNEIWSPYINFTQDINNVPVPATASTAVFEFYVYRNLPLDNLMFYVWHIRSIVGGCPQTWQDRNFVYYGPGPDWLHIFQSVGDLVEPGASDVQLALGVVDMCLYWCGYYGTGACHSHSPLFDRVRFFRVNNIGPVWSVRDIDLFQDNFPTDQTTTGTVRMDMAIDRMPASSPNIYPGDSCVVTVSEPNVGLGTGGAGGRADVYIYVRSTGGQTGQAMSDDATRFPLIGGPTAGGFYQFQCDTVYQDVGMTNPTPDKFCFDLNDNLFAPPDRVDFYFSAKDASGNTTYWSQGSGTTAIQADAEAAPMEVQCLPTGASDILYVDDFSGRGAQPYFDTAFQLMGITPDRYDVRGPSSLVANGLGARAASGQIVDVYHKIIWNSGDLGTGTIGDGSGNPEKSPSIQLLTTFLAQSSLWNPGLYITGDDIAEEMKTLNTAPFITFFTYINYNLTNGNHVAEGISISPLVEGDPAGIFYHTGVPDKLVAFGGCPLVNDFDVLEPTGTARQEMFYSGHNDGLHAAVISQETPNAQQMTARVILEGFSFHYIRDDVVQFPNDRTEHLIDIIRWFENTIADPTGTRTNVLVNSLDQNYPNPFNPTTTIKFSIKERAHVSLKVYNVAGQLVKTLKNDELKPDKYTVTWNGLDNNGRPVASGVYFYKLVTKNFAKTRKMVLLK